MSRIGRLPIAVPSSVDVTIDGTQVTVKGPKGTLSRRLHPDITVNREEATLVVTRPTEVGGVTGVVSMSVEVATADAAAVAAGDDLRVILLEPGVDPAAAERAGG